MCFFCAALSYLPEGAVKASRCQKRTFKQVCEIGNLISYGGKKKGRFSLSLPPSSPHTQFGSIFEWTVVIAISIASTYVLNTGYSERRFGNTAFFNPPCSFRWTIGGSKRLSNLGRSAVSLTSEQASIWTQCHVCENPASQFLKLWESRFPCSGCIRINTDNSLVVIRG